MKNKKVELLAPVGAPEVLSAAVSAGADAIYLGGKRFSARSSAGNFDADEMRRALDYCHERGVKVYPAVNIAVTEREMAEARRYIEELAVLGADALIVSDLGVVASAQRICPELPLHASTQLSLCNRDGMTFARETGMKRVVLARETPLEDIRAMARESGLETEIFVHGALCVSYSGQCLMSSMAGGRSGNRGSCAQTCRREYDLTAAGERFGRRYWLSPRDLCSLRFLPQLLDSGVTSFKIEGRLKRKEYVSAVTRAYREAIDLGGELTDRELRIDELARIFNRGGFTDGYFFDMGKGADAARMYEVRPNHCGVPIGEIKREKNGSLCLRLTRSVSKGDEIELTREGRSVKVLRLTESLPAGGTLRIELRDRADGAALITDDGLLRRMAAEGPYNKVPIRLRLTVRAGKPLVLEAFDGEYRFEKRGAEALAAEGKGTSEERLRASLEKLGGTAYEAEKIEIDSDGAFVRTGDLNALRREITGELSRARTGRNTPRYQVNAPVLSERESERGSDSRPESGRVSDSPESLRRGEPANPAGADSRTSGESGEGAAGPDGSPRGSGTRCDGEDGRDGHPVMLCASPIIGRTVSDIPASESADKPDTAEKTETEPRGNGRPIVTVSTPWAQDAALLEEAERVYFEPRTYDRRTLESALNGRRRPWLALPPVVFADDAEQLEKLSDLFGEFEGAMAQNPGQLVLARRYFKKTGCDRHFNILNTDSLKIYSNLCDTITLSVETTLVNARELCRCVPAELVVYGRVALMNTVYCPLRKLGRCDLCRTAALTDESGRRFALDAYRVRRCVNRIYNCVPLDMRGHAEDLATVDASAYRLMFTDEDEQTRVRVTREYARLARGEAVGAPEGAYTTALYYRGFRE